MSEQIDWSKAPEGATHYNTACFDWYKVGSHEPLFWKGRDWATARFWDDRKHDCVSRPATKQWSGEGLPPVGTVCEARYAPGVWCKATIKYQGKGITVWLWDRQDGNTDQIEFASCPDRLEFRPIRTPEQIAADERASEIAFMASCIAHSNHRHNSTDNDIGAAAHLYSIGYRKP